MALTSVLPRRASVNVAGSREQRVPIAPKRWLGSRRRCHRGAVAACSPADPGCMTRARRTGSMCSHPTAFRGGKVAPIQPTFGKQPRGIARTYVACDRRRRPPTRFRYPVPVVAVFDSARKEAINLQIASRGISREASLGLPDTQVAAKNHPRSLATALVRHRQRMPRRGRGSGARQHPPMHLGIVRRRADLAKPEILSRTWASSLQDRKRLAQ